MSEIDELCCFKYKNAKTSKSKILQLWGFETQLTIYHLKREEEQVGFRNRLPPYVKDQKPH